ncbi:EscU/YscU/HrcU family type III secretion system export apparatus switch protein [uncultured Nitratireductor sp.]|uniref:EscU/YscU/HrcU family type III secretion system export apparatus switch protein n=1 Tax=uncultured Nitratireductor sp. TaxID=520953 RepID=UPI0025F7F13A|nr:EscU/YscU/HrcU family type III secretion system export apparatus switch protein [uncultured Nitratireductor sp.]
MTQESEEKQLPPTEKKLREARRKGQVPQSRDLSSGLSIFAALTYIFFAWPTMSDRLVELMDSIASRHYDDFTEASAFAVHQALMTVFQIITPLAAITAITVIVFGIFATGGPVFSFEPLKPRFEKISPAQGFKRLFSLRNLVEFGKNLLKVVFLSGLLTIILLNWLQPLFEVPGCGSSCLAGTAMSILIPLGTAAALAFVVIGFFDIPVQNWLFRRDMRMTRTEYKRERKDIEGDPQIRQELRRQRRDAVTRPVKRGLENASLVVYHGDRSVALRYVAGETPVPVIVAKDEGSVAAALLSQARSRGYSVVEDAALIDALYPNARVGDDLREDYFPLIARHLVRFGLV